MCVQAGQVLQINLKQSLNGWFISYTPIDCLNQLRANYVAYTFYYSNTVGSECKVNIYFTSWAEQRVRF